MKPSGKGGSGTPSIERGIRERIRRDGPITFADYMERALYAPGGYFDTMPVGIGGDFVTSPHIHPVFGTLVAVALEDLWASAPGTDDGPPTIVELGAGDGTLAVQLLQRSPRARYIGIERSAAGRAVMRDRGLAAHASLDATGIPSQPAIVLANEVLDNLPFHRIARRDHGVVEIRVGLEGDRLVEVEAPCLPALASSAPDLAPGEEATVSPATLALIDSIAPFAIGGAALLIDYPRVASRTGSDVHGYRRHREAADVLAHPGQTDITAGVDFDAVATRARIHGLTAHGPITQNEALRNLGLGDWLEEGRARQSSAQDRRAGKEAVSAWSERQAAMQLIDPGGLGALSWLLLGPPGSSPPPWAGRPRRT